MKFNLKLVCILFVLLGTNAMAQGQSDLPPLAGSWSGELMIGRDALDMTFSFTLANGNYTAAFISRKMGIYGMPAESMEINGNRIKVRLELLAAEYNGRMRMSDSGDEIEFIDGDWFQEGEMVPVMLRRP